MTDANTSWNQKSYGNAYRRCLTCKRERGRAYDERRKANRRAEAEARKQERNDKIRELYAGGMNCADIARTLRVDHETARAVVDPEFRVRKRTRKREAARKRAEEARVLLFSDEKFRPLFTRHRAAMTIVSSLSVNERYELLAAVVWPEDEALREVA